jgi:hypothetical protein
MRYNVEHFPFEISHSVIEIVENVPGGFVDRPVNNLLFEKLPGYFLHQLDAKGIMGGQCHQSSATLQEEPPSLPVGS